MFESVNKMKKMKDANKDKKRKWGEGKLRNNKFERKRNEFLRPDVPKEILDVYDNYGPDKGDAPTEVRGRNARFVKHRMFQAEIEKKKGLIETARTEKLLTESTGLLEVADGYKTTEISQTDIKRSTDITTQCKIFDLSLAQYGPYKFDYMPDGRQIVLGGRRGHLASFDWITKKTDFELNLKESIHDVAFLLSREMIAVAERTYVSVYDNRGTEMHVIKAMHHVHRMQFLREHMLLNTFSEEGFLSYLDVTLGKKVNTIFTHVHGGAPMAVNPYNAHTCIGEPGGVVSMWSPNSKEAVYKFLAQRSPIKHVQFDPSGRYMVLGTLDRRISVWDARNLNKEVALRRYYNDILTMSVSQKGLLAVGSHRQVEVFQGISKGDIIPYMSQPIRTRTEHIQFCPYEDVLGITTENAFHSIVIPGSGEANVDSYETGMFASRKERSSRLVNQLLEKVPQELITLDPHTVRQIDVPTMQEMMADLKRRKIADIPKFNAKPRYRMKGKSTSAKMHRRKVIINETNRRRHLHNLEAENKTADAASEGEEEPKLPPPPKDKHREIFHDNILDRFPAKKKK